MYPYQVGEEVEQNRVQYAISMLNWLIFNDRELLPRQTQHVAQAIQLLVREQDERDLLSETSDTSEAIDVLLRERQSLIGRNNVLEEAQKQSSRENKELMWMLDNNDQSNSIRNYALIVLGVLSVGLAFILFQSH